MTEKGHHKPEFYTYIYIYVRYVCILGRCLDEKFGFHRARIGRKGQYSKEKENGHIVVLEINAKAEAANSGGLMRRTRNYKYPGMGK